MLPALTLLRSGSKGLFSAGPKRQAPLMMGPMFTQLARFVKGGCSRIRIKYLH